jgi:anti-sigma B factor antagonist
MLSIITWGELSATALRPFDRLHITNRRSGLELESRDQLASTRTAGVVARLFSERREVGPVLPCGVSSRALAGSGALLDSRAVPPYNLPVAPEPLTIERLSAMEGPRVLCLRGPLTLENLSSFQNAIRREENVPMVILDLSDVPYIDSSGLGSLVSAYVTRQKATRRIALSGVNDRVLKLFETTKVEPLFLIFPTLDDAITALTTAAEA